MPNLEGLAASRPRREIWEKKSKRRMQLFPRTHQRKQDHHSVYPDTARHYGHSRPAPALQGRHHHAGKAHGRRPQGPPRWQGPPLGGCCAGGAPLRHTRTIHPPAPACRDCRAKPMRRPSPPADSVHACLLNRSMLPSSRKAPRRRRFSSALRLASPRRTLSKLSMPRPRHGTTAAASGPRRPPACVPPRSRSS